jgi:hypothetical protein
MLQKRIVASRRTGKRAGRWHPYLFFNKAAFALACAICTEAEAQQVSTNAPTASPGTSETTIRLPEVVVEGRADSLLGIAESAAQGTVGATQLQERPLLRAGELLETVPGVIVTQHAGGGKANQYFLRGFNLDHGTDFATSIEGMPVNLPTHGHGQGYTDLNILIPELVQRINYRKGVYYSDVGDFSSAGAADIQLFGQLPETTVHVEGGSFGHVRGVVASSLTLGQGTFLYGLEGLHNDGPWERPDNFIKGTGVLRYSQGSEAQGFSVTAMAYHGDWNSSDQIARSAEPVVGRFGSLDKTTGGNSQRYSLSAEWHRADENTATRVMAYGFYYDLDLFSNFTYFLTDTNRGDQFEQTDRRWTGGLNATHTWFGHLGERDMENTVGLQIRSDVIDNGLFNTQAEHREDKVDRDGNFIPATVRNDHIWEVSAGPFYENKIQWFEKLRSVAGVRFDYYHFDVEAEQAPNSGKRDDQIASPKITLVFGPWAKTEIYVQGGLGFHSNDGRGVTTTVDPVTGDAVTKADPLVRTYGAETGVRTTWVPGFQSTLSVWWLDIDSELLFVGDAGTTEASRPSRRYGVEWANYYDVNEWLALDADFSFSHATFRDNPIDPSTSEPVGKHIPGSIESVVAAGITLHNLKGFFASLRLRFFGPRPLKEDNSFRSDETVLLSGQVGYRFNKVWTLSAEIFNILDRKDSDIEYAYESAISPTAPVREEIHFHPVEPIGARVALTAKF